MDSKACWILYGTNEQNVKFVKEKLAPALSLDIKRWIGGLPDLKQVVKKHFSEVLYHSQNEFNGLTDSNSNHNSLFFKLYNREFIYELDSIFRRFSFYYNYDTPFDEQNHCMNVARTILAKLKEDKIKLVMFFEYPHSIGSYVTYLISRFLGLKVIIRTLAPFEDRIFYVEDLKLGIPSHYETMDQDQQNDLDSVIQKATRSYLEAQPGYTKRQNERYFLVSRLKKFAVFVKQQQWKHSFRSLISKTFIPQKGKFVYVGLHYQPELTSFPLGGLYNNQHLMVLMLSAALPEDWKIVVKEHPTIFRYVKKNVTLYRSKKYYTSLKEIPKVEFVDFNHDSFELIDSSGCIATLTGTLGFEGVLRGKPCLVFGEAAYVGCEGVNKVDTFEGLQRIIGELREKNFHVDKEKVLEFTQKALTNTIYSRTNRDFDKFDEDRHLDYILKVYNS